MHEELVEHIVEEHTRQLEQLSERLEKLEQGEVQLQVRIEALCEKLANLTKCLYWLIGLMATSCIGLLSYGLQQILF